MNEKKGEKKNNINPNYLTNNKNLKINPLKIQECELTLEYLNLLLQKLEFSVLISNHLDYYGNSIPLGAFCNSISFILYGFNRCRVLSTNDTFLWGTILIFGGVGQTTAGFFESIKRRTFPSILYLTYGFYCLSHYATYIIPIKFKNYNIYGINHEYASISFFYGIWFIIFIPLVICSLNTNLFFLLQTFFSFLFYFFRWVGEIRDNQPSIKIFSGIFEVVVGFISLYICINQLINEQYRTQLLPAFPLSNENEIDITDEINYIHQY